MVRYYKINSLIILIYSGWRIVFLHRPTSKQNNLKWSRFFSVSFEYSVQKGPIECYSYVADSRNVERKNVKGTCFP